MAPVTYPELHTLIASSPSFTPSPSPMSNQHQHQEIPQNPFEKFEIIQEHLFQKYDGLYLSREKNLTGKSRDNMILVNPVVEISRKVFEVAFPGLSKLAEHLLKKLVTYMPKAGSTLIKMRLEIHHWREKFLEYMKKFGFLHPGFHPLQRECRGLLSSPNIEWSHLTGFVGKRVVTLVSSIEPVLLFQTLFSIGLIVLIIHLIHSHTIDDKHQEQAIRRKSVQREHKILPHRLLLLFVHPTTSHWPSLFRTAFKSIESGEKEVCIPKHQLERYLEDGRIAMMGTIELDEVKLGLTWTGETWRVD